MTIHGVGRWAGVTAVLGLGLLAPPDASAQAIRVLLVIPREPTELTRQVTRLEDAIAALGGPLVPANTLADADAVVQFTDYQRGTAENGQSEDRWDGQFKLLTPPARKTRFPAPVFERFTLLVFGRDKADVRPAAGLLGMTLAKALGWETRETRPAENESI